MKKVNHWLSALGLIAMTAFAQGTLAATCTSISSARWDRNGTWSCGHVPTSADIVVIASGFTVSLRGASGPIAALTIDAGGIINDRGNSLIVSSDITVNGTFGVVGGGGSLVAAGTNAAISGTGTFADTILQIGNSATIVAGSTLNFSAGGMIDVGPNAPPPNIVTLNIAGSITGTGQTAGNTILNGNGFSSINVTGSISASTSGISLAAGDTLTNNGAVSVQTLTTAGGSSWTQGTNSSLTLGSTAGFQGTLNASANGNTVTFPAGAAPITPSANTYFNLYGPTCAQVAGLTILGTGPCNLGSAAKGPTLCVNDPSIGTQPWTGLTNVGAQDNVYAQASGVNGQVTNYLKCTGYNFNIPANAIINGITVGVWRYSAKTMSDQAMQLVKANVIQPTNLATVTRFPTTNTQVLYGGATNLWGNTWAATDINDPNFGAAFAAVRGPFNTTDTAFVDYMPITVDYTLPATPMAEYRMDEAGWSGAANEVVDSSGNGNNAQAFNSASTAATTPAIAGDPGTCRYGEFDNGTTITQGYVQTPLPDLTSDFTVTAWIRTTNNAASGQRILIDDQNNTGGYGISLGDGGAGLVRFYSRGITPVILDSTYAIANNTWYFLAAVADITNRMRTIYVFDAAGTLLNSTTEAAWTGGAWGTDAGPLSIGAETNASGESPATFHFHGNLDEVRVYQRALSQSTLGTIAKQTHACPAALLDHIEIRSSGSGLTCAANTLTVVACQNATCTTLYTGGVSGTLSATGTGMTVNWDGTTGGATGAGFIVPAGSGSVTKNVQVATAGTVAFGVSSAAPLPVNATACNFGNNSPSNNNCVFTASTAGFIFSDTSTPGNVYTIPPQVSGIATPTLYLRAVQATTTNPAVCNPAIVGQTVAVNMGYTCNNPATCQAGNLATINATAVAPTGTSVNLAFDSNGSSTITVRYDDVGRITLNANATVTPFGGSTAVVLNGNSNAYVVAPHHFGFSGITAAPIKAGNNFAANVAAYNGLATPTVTANFGNETPTAEAATLSFTKCQPTGTNSSSGTFSGNGKITFTNGVASLSNLNWSEVGNIDLAATLFSGSYLASGLTATGNTGTGGTVCNGAGNVGRFIPDHFDTAIVAASGVPMACPAGLTCPCPNGSTCPPSTSNGFVYSGQTFTTQVTAKNLANGITQNYDGTTSTTPNFAKNVTLTAWSGPGSTTATPGSITGTSGTISFSSFSKGATISPGIPGAPIYAFSTTPTAPTDIYIRAVDADSVTSLRVPANTSVEDGIKVVSGRIKLANAYGSELLPLPITATAQYFNTAGGWVTSSTDSTSQFNTNLTPAGDVKATIVNGPLALGNIGMVTPGMVTFANGIRTFRLAAPNVAGSADLQIITAPSYLLPSTAGRATFGVYNGSNEIIYMREMY